MIRLNENPVELNGKNGCFTVVYTNMEVSMEV